MANGRAEANVTSAWAAATSTSPGLQGVRVLHLLSNWKWTGPAEPAVNTAVALHREGVETLFVCGQPPAGQTGVAQQTQARGLPSLQTDLTLSKHGRPLTDHLEVRKLRQLIVEHQIDVVHCHLANDHALAARAVAKLEHVRLIRTCYDGDRFPRQRRRLKPLARTDGLICISERVCTDLKAELGFPHDRVFMGQTPIDCDRFNPNRPLPNLRERWGIAPEAVVVGIVARMQRHRHFEVLIDALVELHRLYPQLRMVIVGRGTHQVQVAHEPVRERGLTECVVFAGYLNDDDYVGALKAFDLKVFMVPGSDGSCRAVREALAMGVPVVSTDLGMLDEIVANERTGLVTNGSAEGLERAVGRLVSDGGLRSRMASEAAAHARREFALPQVASKTVKIYRYLMAQPPRS